MAEETSSGPFHAWNPGLESRLPSRLRSHVSLFQRLSISNTLEEIDELHDFCGLPAEQLATFTAERLAIHELLVRVTADLSVPDGPNYEDLGINMRGMVHALLQHHIKPELAALTDLLSDTCRDAEVVLRDEINKARKELDNPAAASKSAVDAKITSLPVLAFLLGKLGLSDKKSQLDTATGNTRVDTSTDSGADLPAEGVQTPPQPLDEAMLDMWVQRQEQTGDDLRRTCLNQLINIAKAIIAHRGRLVGGEDLLVRLALIGVSNAQGSGVLGQAIDPLFRKGCMAQGYTVLPAQSEPVILNVKGASASGKSTIRSHQRALVERTGVKWEEFAVISPDYWRKYLLDYDSLGEDYKYAGSLTGQELWQIDQKLDRYMSRKAEEGLMSHLLIDRFRFDSFSIEDNGLASSKLLTRFGKTIYLFFMITPPEATVERAWIRGNNTGRYKPVDDLLYHNVEAYTGMPLLFLSWVSSKDKNVHFEFLDNSVALGETPRTIASGWNSSMRVYDLDGLLNIEKFRKIHVDANEAEAVYRSDAEKDNWGFLKDCCKQLEQIEFRDPESGEIYARIFNQKWEFLDIDRAPTQFDPAAIIPRGTSRGASKGAQHAMSATDSAETAGPDSATEPLGLADRTFADGTFDIGAK